MREPCNEGRLIGDVRKYFKRNHDVKTGSRKRKRHDASDEVDIWDAPARALQHVGRQVSCRHAAEWLQPRTKPACAAADLDDVELGAAERAQPSEHDLFLVGRDVREAPFASGCIPLSPVGLLQFD